MKIQCFSLLNLNTYCLMQNRFEKNHNSEISKTQTYFEIIKSEVIYSFFLKKVL